MSRDGANVWVDSAAQIHSSRAERIKLRNTLPPQFKDHVSNALGGDLKRRVIEFEAKDETIHGSGQDEFTRLLFALFVDHDRTEAECARIDVHLNQRGFAELALN